MLVKKRSNETEEENIFWVTMTDLMLGLAMVFIILFVFTMVGFSKNKMEEQNKQAEISKALQNAFVEKGLNVEIDKLSGKIKISDLELFELNSFELSEKGKKYLDKFVPIYVNTIFSKSNVRESIENIVIQGHTDSQTYAGIHSADEQFIKNMELSLKRANSVAAYIFQTNYDKKYNDILKKILVVEGKSYSDPVLINGKEDFDKSRRVELKLNVKTNNIKDIMGIISK